MTIPLSSKHSSYLVRGTSAALSVSYAPPLLIISTRKNVYLLHPLVVYRKLLYKELHLLAFVVQAQPRALLMGGF